MGKKGPKLYILSYIEGDRKIEINIGWNFKVKSLFLRLLSQNIAVLTPVVTSLTQNRVKKEPTSISCINSDRKINLNTKGKSEVKYSFLQPLSQNFEVLTALGDVINAKLAQKRVETRIPCINGDKKMKIKRGTSKS